MFSVQRSTLSITIVLPWKFLTPNFQTSSSSLLFIIDIINIMKLLFGRIFCYCMFQSNNLSIEAFPYSIVSLFYVWSFRSAQNFLMQSAPLWKSCLLLLLLNEQCGNNEQSTRDIFTYFYSGRFMWIVITWCNVWLRR